MSILIKDLNIIYISSFWKSNINQLNVPEKINNFINFKFYLQNNFPEIRMLSLDNLNDLLPDNLKIIDEISEGVFITSLGEVINYSDYFDGNYLPSGIKGFSLVPQDELFKRSFDRSIDNLINYTSIDLIQNPSEFLKNRKEQYCLYNFKKDKDNSSKFIKLKNLKDEEIVKEYLEYIIKENEIIIENYLQKKESIYNGFSYSCLKEICNKMEYPFQAILNTFHILEREVSYDKLLDFYKYSNKKFNSTYSRDLTYDFIYKGKSFSSVKSACLHYKLNYNNVEKEKKKKNLLSEEVLDLFLFKKSKEEIKNINKNTKKEKGFIFLQQHFDSFKDCCEYYGFTRNQIYQYASRAKITKEKALEFYIKGKK